MKLNKNVIKVVCFGLIFCILFMNIQTTLINKGANDYSQVKGFYTSKMNADVVFIGNSHIYCSINPLLLFKEYGIVSENFSSAGQNLALTLLYTTEAVKTMNPKVIVVDAYSIVLPTMEPAYHRLGVDPLPLSIEKMRQVMFMRKHNEEFNGGKMYDSFSSYIFPILSFHSRWKELGESDFVLPDLRNYHGYAPSYNNIKADFSYYYEESTLGIYYDSQKKLFNTLVDICKNNNIELLIIKSPSPRWREDYHNIVTEWAKEKEVPFLDYNQFMDELDINVDKDFRDADSHLNDYGATKMTIHLGMYLSNKYSLKDYRNEKKYSYWFDDWEVYYTEKLQYE